MEKGSSSCSSSPHSDPRGNRSSFSSSSPHYDPRGNTSSSLSSQGLRENGGSSVPGNRSPRSSWQASSQSDPHHSTLKSSWNSSDAVRRRHDPYGSQISAPDPPASALSSQYQRPRSSRPTLPMQIGLLYETSIRRAGLGVDSTTGTPTWFPLHPSPAPSTRRHARRRPWKRTSTPGPCPLPRPAARPRSIPTTERLTPPGPRPTSAGASPTSRLPACLANDHSAGRRQPIRRGRPAARPASLLRAPSRPPPVGSGTRWERDRAGAAAAGARTASPGR